MYKNGQCQPLFADFEEEISCGFWEMEHDVVFYVLCLLVLWELSVLQHQLLFIVVVFSEEAALLSAPFRFQLNVVPTATSTETCQPWAFKGHRGAT